MLDIGCGYGVVTVDRFGADNRFEVVAADNCERALETARSWFAKENIKYEHIDIEAPVSRYQEEFDIVVAAYLLHHVPRDEQVLQYLWEYVADGGALFVRSCDDGQHMHYPEDERIEYVVEKTREVGGDSDRLHGRRLPTQFNTVLSPTPDAIDFNVRNYSTAGKPPKKREQYWEVFHSPRRYGAEQVLENSGEVTDEVEAAKTMIEYMDELRGKFLREDGFVDVKSVPVGIAYKNPPNFS